MNIYFNNTLIWLFLGKKIGAGFATIGLLGAGIGIGIIFASFLISCSINFEKKNELFAITLLGFALTEAIALFSLMMAFLILYI